MRDERIRDLNELITRFTNRDSTEPELDDPQQLDRIVSKLLQLRFDLTPQEEPLIQCYLVNLTTHYPAAFPIVPRGGSLHSDDSEISTLIALEDWARAQCINKIKEVYHEGSRNRRGNKGLAIGPEGS